MSKDKIRDTNFRPDSLARIEQLSDIVDEYQQQGLRLTARQLYYQLVSRDIIANSVAEYKKLTSLLTDARYAGMIDWAAIEDRNREPDTPSEWDDPAQLVESALRAYRLPRWEGQPTYVELWVEKAALAGVLQPLAREFHATLMVNRGYSSASAMYESAERIKKATIIDQQACEALIEEFNIQKKRLEHTEPEKWKKTADRLVDAWKKTCRRAIVLYLGDHDPSGEDMVRDINDRLKEFGVLRLEVEKVGLTIAQVKQYNPPPNPAKITDSRAAAYIEKFGHHSWEVDALPPQVLTTLIRAAFRKHIDKSKMDEIKKREETDKELLRKAVAGMMKRRDT
jgi:hypothetical protein